jgi:hypothetical protein
MYRFQASVHNAAVQASRLQRARRVSGRGLILRTHAYERGVEAQNRDRIAVCVHTFAQCQLRGREWLS